MRPRLAITLVFFANGALFASWASRIPALSDSVGAGPGSLSVALLAPAVGAVITMPLIGRLLPRRSSRGFCQLALATMMLALLLPGLARSVPALAAALFLVGIANAALDLSMNAQGVTVERHLGAPILSSLHAAFSLGGFAGAGVGALAAALRIDPLVHFAAAGGLFGLVGLLACTRLLAHDREGSGHGPERARAFRMRRPPTRLLLLGLACFFCFLAEGGASDWSANLVRNDLGGTAALGAIAYAAFSIAMASGRMIADRLWARWGAAGLLRRSGALAAGGFTIGLGLGTVPSALVGFVALGLGLSGVVPTLFRAASDQPGVPTGPALAAVSSLGYVGFLTGPPIIGAIAALTTLRLACGMLVLAGVVVILLAPTARPIGRPARLRAKVAA